MLLQFHSGFSEKLSSFVTQKNSLGFPYKESIRILYEFDAMCAEYFPNENVLSQEICMRWAIRKETEQNNSFNNRLMPIREFAKYLIRIGENAYVIEDRFVKKKPRHTPYIFSEKEILLLWRFYDSVKQNPEEPVKHLAMAAIVRLLYCCGLRPIEATRLRVQDVNLLEGKIYIIESKGHKDRIVMMHSDLKNYLENYDKKVQEYMPNRRKFFPNHEDDSFSVVTLDRAFRNARTSCNIIGTSIAIPRLYDFRHTFATHRLYQWMKEGKDLSTMLPYLSAYMGHTDLASTYYYIHFVPGQFESMSGYDGSSLERLIPEVKYNE